MLGDFTQGLRSKEHGNERLQSLNFGEIDD